jgi:hypothetical protein
VGATYEGLSSLLNSPSLSSLVLGLVIETPTSLDISEEHFSSTALSYDTTSTRYGSADIPLLVSFGTSYTFSDRYTVAADVATQSWGNAKSFGVHPQELRNSLRAGAGIELAPRKDANSYFSHIVYRAGFFYDASYLQINNQGIDGMFLTAGLGLPIGPESHLNLGFQFGVQGTTSNGLQKDTIFRLTASISGSELWFVRLAED